MPASAGAPASETSAMPTPCADPSDHHQQDPGSCQQDREQHQPPTGPAQAAPLTVQLTIERLLGHLSAPAPRAGSQRQRPAAYSTANRVHGDRDRKLLAGRALRRA